MDCVSSPEAPGAGPFLIWPQAEKGAVSLSRAQLSMLLEGIDWRRPFRTSAPTVAV